MSKVNVVRRCFNCGALLQNIDPTKEGYISNKDLLSSSLDRVLFCDKCYDESGFTLTESPLKVSEDLLLMMKDARASDALIVYIINSFSFETSFVKEVNEIIKRNPILVLANKRDLLGQATDDETFKEYVAHHFHLVGIPLEAKDVLLTSLATFGDSKPIAKEIEERRRRHDVYVLSSHGAGKTMFISSFLYHFKNETNHPVETSPYPGTNVPLMQIPLDNSSKMYDVPALPSTNNIVSKLEKEVADSLLFSSPVKYKKITMEQGNALALGGIAFIELLSLPKNSLKMDEIHLFVSPKITLKKIGVVKGFESAFPRYIAKKGIYPKSNVVRSLKDLDVFDIEVEEKGDRSIGIEGLGWFSFLGRRQTYRIYVPKGVSVYTSRSKILTYDHSSKK